MFIFASQTPILPTPYPWDDVVNWPGDSGAAFATEGAGNDSLYRGKGDDNIKGGKGSDIDVPQQEDDLLLDDAGTHATFGEDGADFTTEGVGDNTPGHGSGDDNIKGGKGADIRVAEHDDLLFDDAGTHAPFGDSGADFATEGAGFDTLDGGKGDDNILGGKGDDTYDGEREDDLLFGDADGLPDTAVGFEDGSDGDPLDLNDLLTGAEPLADALQPLSNDSEALPQTDADGGGNAGHSNSAIAIPDVAWSGDDLSDPIADSSLIIA